MCDTKSQGGRRCPKATPAYRRQKRAEKRAAAAGGLAAVAHIEMVGERMIAHVKAAAEADIDPATKTRLERRILAGAKADSSDWPVPVGLVNPDAGRDRLRRAADPLAFVGNTGTAMTLAARQRDARHLAEEQYSDWADNARLAEISASATMKCTADLKTAIITGRQVGAWTVHDRFDEADGYAWAHVKFNYDELHPRTRDYLDNDLGWESDEGVAVFAPDGTVEVSLNGGAAKAFEDIRFARDTGDRVRSPRFTAEEVEEAAKRADHDEWVRESEAARKTE